MSEPGVESPLLLERDGAVFTITLNRPAKMNTFTPEMYVRLAEAWREFAGDDELRVAIFTGAGERAFTAGADLGSTIPLLNGTSKPANDYDKRLLDDRSIMDDSLLRDYVLNKPVIAAINGVSVGAGMEMLQATDIRLAVPTARFGLPEVRQGLIPGGGSITRLVRQIPWAIAAEILLTGEPISAEKALAIGLINEIVEPDQLLVRARQIADRIASNGPLAVCSIKEGMQSGSGRPMQDSLDIERRLLVRVLASEDSREGPRAFMEKRTPNFTGK
jgi:enoyl-CoA hydratase